jgi:hypothetical protein
LFCVLSGLSFTTPALSQGHFGWLWLSGVITAAALVPVLRFGPRHPLAQIGTIFLALVVVGLACTLSEAVVFDPEMKKQLLAIGVGGTVNYLIVAAVMVALGKALKLSEFGQQAVAHRTVGMAIPMVLLAGVSYLVYYEIFGAITFEFFTRQYYPHAVEQAQAMGLWFFVYQAARGVLMTLAVLPVIYTLRLPRWQAALAVGILAWIVGGGAPLLVPNTMMVATQRYIHIVEIMTQNVSLGITALLLLRPRAAAAAAPIHSGPGGKRI